MRAAPWLACTLLLLSGGATTGCIPDKDKQPEWQKPPKSFDVKEADLTFNEARIEAFNSMELEQRDAHVAELKGKAGSFKGQAIFKRGSELGESMDDLEFGKFEIYALAPGPDELPADGKSGVWLEVTIEYHLFSEQDFSTGWPPNSYIEFTGTLADLSFQSESKPRKMVVKVKADDVHIIKE